MQVTRTKCDQCGKETSDRYLEPGWIEIGGSSLSITNVSVSIDGHEDGVARMGRWSGRSLDFCSIACMAKFLKRLGKKKGKR